MGEINKYDYYVALITVTATEEAGLKHMYKNWEPLFLEGDDQKYYQTSFERGGKTFKVVTARQNEMGMTAAGVLTMKMISVFRPKYMFMVGAVSGCMNQTATLTKEDGHMADKEFKRLIHSWWTVLLPKKRMFCVKGGIRIEAIP